MSWNLRDCHMVGSVCSLRSSAPFSRDAVVLTNEKHPDILMIRGREYANGLVEGERMTKAEWRDLLECEEALAFSEPVETGPNAKCWLLHETFPEREQAAGQLRTCTGAILHEEACEGVLIFVVDESRAADQLERWSRDAFDRAWRLGQQGEWDGARELADLAWLTDRSLNLDRVALLALVLENAEGASAAEDLIAFELNSRVGRPEPELRALIARYRLQFYLSQRLASRLVMRMNELRNRVGDVERWKKERAKTDKVFPFQPPAAHAPKPRAA